MGLNDYWNDQANKADDFLSTGKFSDVVRNAPLNNDIVDLTGAGGGDFSQQGGCTSTSQCPAGYACVNGRCRSMWQGPTGGTSGGQWNNAGECDQDDPNSPCNQGGPSGCQSTPTCGDGDPLQPKPEDCCDQKRCCSFGSASSARPGIHCYCGECPPLPKCSSFCAGYEAANGETGPGCSSGDTGNSCNACSYCEDGQCKPKEPGPFTPCWCDGGKDCGETGPCNHCQTDPDEDDFGECVYKEENCQDCATLRNHICSCGKILPPITICKPKSQGGKTASTLVREEAARRCAEVCDIDCTDFSAGNLPEECKDCDCNCHDDCPECQLCGSNGECYPDPECELGTGKAVLEPYFSGSEVTTYLCESTEPGGCIDPSTSACPATPQDTLCGKLPFRWNTITPSSGGQPYTLQAGTCAGGFKQWRSNPNFVAGSYELLDADGLRVFGPTSDASCVCLNCCEDSIIHQAAGTPNYRIVEYREC